MDYKELIQKAFSYASSLEGKGELASYIPELKNVDPDKFGVYIATNKGFNFGLGDYNDTFSIQSISKVLSLSLAYKTVGEDIWKRLDVEPSGNPFNSLLQLENDNGIPRNPFINAGAIVISDILLSNLVNPKEDFFKFVRELSEDCEIDYSAKVAKSEKETGFRNFALCNFLKSLGNIENNPEDVLDFYFDLCSLTTNSKGLANLFLLFANQGKTLPNNLEILTKSQSKRINAIMQTCGFYDESGEFAFRVGLAGKSGVSGAIVAIHPDEYAIVSWSPKLNKKGNSYKGFMFLEEFTTLTEDSIF